MWAAVICRIFDIGSISTSSPSTYPGTEKPPGGRNARGAGAGGGAGRRGGGCGHGGGRGGRRPPLLEEAQDVALGHPPLGAGAGDLLQVDPFLGGDAAHQRARELAQPLAFRELLAVRFAGEVRFALVADHVLALLLGRVAGGRRGGRRR